MFKMASKEFISIATEHGHASNLLACGDQLLMTWWGGSPEPNDNIRIYVAYRENGQWSNHIVIDPVGDFMHWNSVLYDAGDHIDLFFKAGKHLWDSLGYRSRSYDGGKTFSKAELLVPGEDNVRGPVRNKMLKLSNGRLLAPSSREYEDNHTDAFVDISDDNGKTFRASPFVPLLRPGVEPEGDGLPYCLVTQHGKLPCGVIQPAMWETDSHNVSMMMRSSTGRMLRSDSYDNGEHWCMAYDSGMPNNNSGIDLVKLDDGRIVLLCNPTEKDWGARTPLNMYISEDDGKTFKMIYMLEDGPGEYSYPAIIANGLHIYLSYTYHRKCFAVWDIEMNPRK